MAAERILIVDDEESIRNQLRWGLADEYEILTAATADEARRMLREHRPAIVTLDVTLSPPGGPAEEGLRLLDEIVDRHPFTKVIMVTGNERRENAIMALRRGAVDWYAKPIQLEELKVILQRALHILEIERAEEPERLGRRRYHRLIGDSEPIRRVYGLIQRVAPTDATVLAVGENGTGKELVAHAIHEASARRDGPFVPINCGAIPENLLESELFGHERGSFTDAHRTREGRVELAAGGTLFLDEIGDLPLLLQVKLLRFLQDRTIERIGGRETTKVDARVVAATNRDLKTAIAAGRFREDLYYRLSVITVTVPPLRDRGEDIRLLADYFFDFYTRHHQRRLKGFTQSALRAILTHPWPGNVRELENRVQRAVILAQDAYLRPEDLELESGESAAPRSLQSVRDDAERHSIEEAMSRNAGNVSRAARDLGVSRPSLHDLLRKHAIDAAAYRRPGGGSDGGEERRRIPKRLDGRGEPSLASRPRNPKAVTPPREDRSGVKNLRGTSFSESRAARECHRTSPPARHEM